MSRKISVSLLLACLMCLMVSVVYAQDGPRPTPTDIGPTAPGTPEPPSSARGTVRGFVYADVNGDGRCMNTGVAGEEPVAGVPVEFVNSDGKYVITHTSGENGAYELAGAGQSNWRVTAQTGSDWVVTSENPRYALVSADNLAATDVNFCVAKAGTAVYPLTAPLTFSSNNYVLPDSGAPAQPTTIFWPVLLGLGLIAFGLAWRWNEISRK
jgi:SdrD B-like domain